ncbi:MAG: hypothetical protein Q7K43_00755 [Candidatus Woesearchaeota archaeon]|nr:hypothetical protein [Candidatus Woesearchaeota archaeon]
MGLEKTVKWIVGTTICSLSVGGSFIAVANLFYPEKFHSLQTIISKVLPAQSQTKKEEIALKNSYLRFNKLLRDKDCRAAYAIADKLVTTQGTAIAYVARGKVYLATANDRLVSKSALSPLTDFGGGADAKYWFNCAAKDFEQALKLDGSAPEAMEYLRTTYTKLNIFYGDSARLKKLDEIFARQKVPSPEYISEPR